jgi:hypothetical protein
MEYEMIAVCLYHDKQALRNKDFRPLIRLLKSSDSEIMEQEVDKEKKEHHAKIGP